MAEPAGKSFTNKSRIHCASKHPKARGAFGDCGDCAGGVGPLLRFEVVEIDVDGVIDARPFWAWLHRSPHDPGLWGASHVLTLFDIRGGELTKHEETPEVLDPRGKYNAKI